MGIVSFGVWRNLFSVVDRGGLTPPGDPSTPAFIPPIDGYPPNCRLPVSAWASGLTTTMGGAGDERSGDANLLRSGVWATFWGACVRPPTLLGAPAFAAFGFE